MSDSMQKNVVSLESYGQLRRGLDDTPEKRVLREAARLASDRLHALIERMMDRVDDALFERAEKAENNALQTRYFDAMRELRIVRQDIEQDFISLFVSGFDSGLCQNIADTELELRHSSSAVAAERNRDRLEEQLAIGNLINKIRGNCFDSLVTLDKRIGLLLHDPDLERIRNPLGPEAICNAFWTAAKRVAAGLEIRLVIFKLFDQHVGAQIDNIYKEITNYLIRMGVLPELKAKPHAISSPAGPTTLDRDAYHRPGLESGTGATRYTTPDLAALPMASGIQPCYRSMVQAPDANSVPMAAGIQPCYKNRRQLPDAASVPMAPGVEPSHGVYTPLSAAAGSPAAARTRQRGSATCAGPRPQTDETDLICQQQETLVDPKESAEASQKTSDLVALLFEHIHGDANIPGAMRTLIGRMHSPILATALLDAGFFSDQSHPARALLNRLASAAVQWDGHKGDQDALYGKIETIVQTACDLFDNDMSLFAELDAELDEFLQRTEQEAELRADRSARVMEGQERLEAAESTTMLEIQPRIDSGDNLNFVRDFVATHWKNLLFMTCAREGKDSEAWNQAVTTMDDLIWSVKPKRTREERHKLVELQPQLLNSLRQGMERLSVPATERDDFIARLVRAHGRTAVIGDSTRQADASESQEQPGNRAQNKAHTRKRHAIAVQRETGSEAHAGTPNDKYTAYAHELEVGTWLEFRGEDGLPRRAKLSWVSPITGTRLFTDREGLKAGNYSIDELAQLLRHARARILTTEPLMELAVNKALMQCNDH